MNQRLHRGLAALLIAALALAVFPARAQDDSPIAGGPRTITGSYTTTNPIYPTIGAETGIVLYDLAGLVQRDFDFEPPPETQQLGTLNGDIVSGTYTLTLPDTPNGTPLDFDGDAATPPAVQVFVPATFIDFLGDDYLNRGEMLLDMAARLAPLTFNITGGHVIVWAAETGEAFPAGFGADGAAFTDDDPLLELPAGWSVVALEHEPFTILRDETVDVPIIESLGALNDYSGMDYGAAWEALYARTRETYPFTQRKNLDWDAIYDMITPLVAQSESALDFHLTLAHFGELVPDTHIGYASLPVMQNLMMGGIGIAGVAITNTGAIVVTDVVDALPASNAGIQNGDVLLTIDGADALRYLDDTPLLLTSASTPHSKRYLQAATMFQGPLGSQIALTWRDQDTGNVQRATLTRVIDFSAILSAFAGSVFADGVVTSRMLDSGIGYIRVSSFAMEVSDADRLFEQALQDLIDAQAGGIILDLRGNSGGLLGLAMAMAGRFFPDYQRLLDLYYADGTGDFAYRGFVEILAGEPYYDGPVAVLVDAMTGSAGDIFAYAMRQNDNVIIVGHTPSGGFTGEVSDGQYRLPGGLNMQIPTGRLVHPETQDIMLEGVGVIPDLRVPITLESIRSPEDEVLRAAEAELLAAAQRSTRR